MSDRVAEEAELGEEADGVEGTPLRYDAVHAWISPRDEVLRLLPTHDRRMVGAWCFVDLYGPREVLAGVEGGAAMHVAPHPHIGLQTVSWLVQGEVTHRDSLGTTAVVTPGRAAVMTAGSGIAHAEDVVAGAFEGTLHGAQLWVALPEAERHRRRSFALHELAPEVDIDGLTVQVFVGSFGGVAGAEAFTPLLGAEIRPLGPDRSGVTGAAPGGGRLLLDPAYEHAVVPLAGWAEVAGIRVKHGQAVYLGPGRDTLDVGLSPDARVLLLGGAPFEEEIVMWWNLVARTHAEIEQAREQWNATGDARFGEVTHYPTDERLAAPPLPNVRLRPRGRVR